MSTTDNGNVGEQIPVVRVSTDVDSDRGHAVADAIRGATDTVRVIETGPTGITGIEPLVLVTSGTETAVYPAVDQETVRAIRDAIETGEIPTAGATTTITHAPDPPSLPVPERGPLAVGQRAVLGPCGWVDPLAPAAHTFVATDAEISQVTDCGLLARGRGDAVADAPAVDAWDRAREADGEPVIVVNANEADPRPRGDRTLLAGTPLSVLDGAAAVAQYVGATDVVVHLNETDGALVRHVRDAATVTMEQLPVEIQVTAGPDVYRAGAPTAALEVLEGADRIEPRLQPPPPAEHGLYGRPTVVHTPRTFAQVQYLLAHPSAVDTTTADPGTRLVTVTGDVSAPATVELDSTAHLGDALAAVDSTGQCDLACVGGVFGGITDDLSVPVTASSLSSADLGTDGVIEVLTEQDCVVAEVGTRVRFAAEENSGRCVPGREGTQQLAELLREIYDGSFRAEDIRELARVMRRTSNCQIGAQAPRPVTTAMHNFEAAFRAHASGRCPSGACEGEL